MEICSQYTWKKRLEVGSVCLMRLSLSYWVDDFKTVLYCTVLCLITSPWFEEGGRYYLLLFEKIYLHVDLENVAALNLYKSEGYVEVGSRWNPFWAGQAAEIGYYDKQL